MDKIINVGLIGFGLGGRVFHAPIINSVHGLVLHSVFTKNQHNIEQVHLQYPNVVVVASVDEILEDAAIELVVVASTNDTHYSIAKKALEAGKNVVVEKPFTVTPEEAGELVALAQKVGKLLTVNQNRRWDSDYLTVKKVIDSGLIGNVTEYEAHFDRYRTEIKDSWKEEDRAGNGLLYDLGSHLIDQAVELFGIPEKVTCFMGSQRPKSKIPDYFELILHYDKMKAVLKAGMLVREKGPHFIVHGDRGSFVKYGMDVQEEALKKGMIPDGDETWGMEPENQWGTIHFLEAGLSIRGTVQSEVGDYRALYRNVRDVLNGKEVLQVLPHQAKNSIKIIELAIRSNQEGRTVFL